MKFSPCIMAPLPFLGEKETDLRLQTKHLTAMLTSLPSLMFIPCIIRCIRRDQQYALIVPLLYSTYWLLHVLAVACHHQGTY
jgi:hypothetical protein